MEEDRFVGHILKHVGLVIEGQSLEKDEARYLAHEI